MRALFPPKSPLLAPGARFHIVSQAILTDPCNYQGVESEPWMFRVHSLMAVLDVPPLRKPLSATAQKVMKSMDAHLASETTNRTVITEFVDAINARDTKRLLSLFAADAVINDQLSEFQGTAAIEVWAHHDVADVSLSIQAMSIRRHYGCTIMKGSVDGNFDKRGLPDPLLYKFYFVLACEKIVLLVVLRDEA